MGTINFTQILSATLVLLSIIDIVGSIPIILQLREKGRHVDAVKATLYSTLLMVGFYYGGHWLLRIFNCDIHSFATAGGFLMFLISTDAGTTWTLLTELALTHTLTQYTYGLNVPDNVRFKFQQTAGARVNIDDIAVYAAAPVQHDPHIYFSGAIESLIAELDGESSISEVAVITEDNDQPVTVTVNENFEFRRRSAVEP